MEIYRRVLFSTTPALLPQTGGPNTPPDKPNKTGFLASLFAPSNPLAGKCTIAAPPEFEFKSTAELAVGIEGILDRAAGLFDSTDADLSFYDLGYDSLDRIYIAQKLESELGLTITASSGQHYDLISSSLTPRQLLDFIAQELKLP